MVLYFSFNFYQPKYSLSVYSLYFVRFTQFGYVLPDLRKPNFAGIACFVLHQIFRALYPVLQV